MEYTDKTTLKEIKSRSELSELKKYLLYGGIACRILERIPVGTMRSAGWKPEELFDTTEKLCKRTESGAYKFDIYNKKEQKNDRKKRDCHVVFFPAEKEQSIKKPYIIVCAGGAYSSIWNLSEAYPVAMQFSRLGYSAFTLNYRIGGKGLMPKPIDDLAQAIRFIKKNEKEFNVEGENYIVCGFSAGGNLTGQWGTENHGYKTYGLPKPAALFPIYPAINNNLFEKNKNTEKFMVTMFGKNYSEDKKNSYNIDEHVGKDFPASYIVCCKDDKDVPCQNAIALTRKLETYHVPVHLEMGEKGGHGFGTGSGTDVEDWTKRAISFYENLNKE